MPSGPPVTAWTASVFVTIVKTISLWSATSRGLAAQRAPAASSGSAFSRVRFHTVTVWPASSSLRLIARPITPRPTKPSSAMDDALFHVRLDADEMGTHLLPRPLGIARGNRRPDRAVLDDRPLGAAGDQEDGQKRTADDVSHRLHAVEDEPV